jgi:deazaflavin-dependent oxidoreductase (nitroreductase family)
MQTKSSWHKLIQKLAAMRGSSWALSKILPSIDRQVFRLSGGRQTLANLLSGLPTILVTSTGAKSGLPRTTPLAGIPERDGFIIIGSNLGQKHHPAWVYNVRAHPKVRIDRKGKTSEYTAREVSGEERQRLWDKALTYYQGFNAYDARVEREIAVFMLEPKNHT